MASVSLIKEHRDVLDVDQLVKQYMPLVRRIAKHYSRFKPDSFEDLLQVGCVGLLKAIKYYDPQRPRKASFKSVAICYIKGDIRHYLRDHSSLVQIPRRLNEINQRIVQLEEVLTKELEHTPSVEELSQRSGYSQADVCEAQKLRELCIHLESLDAVEELDGREESRSLCEIVPDKRYQDKVAHLEDREILLQALYKLGETTRQIIEFVYFYDFTQKEAAQLLGVSEMGVSRSIKRALKTLKEVLFIEIL